MRLFIKIRDGKPYEHPMLEDNMRAAFPDIDLDNLPDTFAEFKRIAPPVLGVYQIYEGVSYEWDGAIVKDTHYVREMTQNEILQKQLIAHQWWNENGYSSWTFDEDTCSYIPPINQPDDGKRYKWDEQSNSWILIP